MSHRYSLRRLLFWVTFAAIVFFVLGFFWRAFDAWDGLSLSPDLKPKPFNSAEWKSWSEGEKSSHDRDRRYLRADMLDDLLKSHNFTGWSVPQLTELLGPPSVEFKPPESDIAYFVCMDWVDYKVLVFKLDKNQRVSEYHVELD
jgi:hypothetical protein